MVPHYDLNPNIMVLSLFPGIQANIFEHALDAPELKGVVMRSFGSGNAPQQAWLIETLKSFTAWRFYRKHQSMCNGIC